MPEPAATGTINPLMTTLRGARIAQNLSTRRCAERAGISNATISECERGLHLPHLDSLIPWADALGYDLLLKPREPGDDA